MLTIVFLLMPAESSLSKPCQVTGSSKVDAIECIERNDDVVVITCAQIACVSSPGRIRWLPRSRCSHGGSKPVPIDALQVMIGQDLNRGFANMGQRNEVEYSKLSYLGEGSRTGATDAQIRRDVTEPKKIDSLGRRAGIGLASISSDSGNYFSFDPSTMRFPECEP